jgi:alanyl-tRNA synthetase
MTAKRPVEADSHPAVEERPVDEAELRQEIEQTREQLGETVEELAAKADVKGRARVKAAELAGRAKSTAAQARTQATTRASRVGGQLAGRSAVARQKVAAAGGTAKAQLQARAAPVREATPEPVRCVVANGASTAQQRRVPLAVAAVTLIAGYVVFRWWRKR